MRTFSPQLQPTQQAKTVLSAKPNQTFSRHRRELNDTLHWLRTLGNQAAQRAEADGVRAHGSIRGTTCIAHGFSRIPVQSMAAVKPQKLEIDRPADEYEQEPDRISEQVMRKSEPQLQRSSCACGGECPKCQTHELTLNPTWTRPAWNIQPNLTIGPADDAFEREADNIAERVMGMPGADFSVAASSTRISRKRAAGQGGDSAAAPPAPPSVYAALASPGRPLDAVSRAYFEPRLGVGLESVRVHDDAAAASSASDVSARAYTVGHDIVLAGGSYRHDDPAARSVLAHELVHVLQQTPDRPVLQRFPACSRLLNARDGAFVAEAAVQEYLAEELEGVGETQRELRIPGGSAAPWRTDGRDDTVIDPQHVHEWISGQVDVALQRPGDLALQFLEVKRASWPGAEFAENQVVNYVDKGNAAIFNVQGDWRRRTRNPNAIVTSVREMPQSTYVPPQGPVRRHGQQVMLAWCRSGVMVFKSSTSTTKSFSTCGISDRGRTDAFIGRILGQAEEMVARALMRRLREMFPGGTGNIRPLLDKIREKLRVHAPLPVGRRDQDHVRRGARDHGRVPARRIQEMAVEEQRPCRRPPLEAHAAGVGLATAPGRGVPRSPRGR